MDLNGVWQENKRFIVIAGSGALVFLVGWLAIGSYLGDDLAAQRRAADSTARKLTTEPMYSPDDQIAAEKENTSLKGAVAALKGGVAFATRTAFTLDPKKGAASNQYFAIVSGTREDLLRRAGRANVRIPEDLGLPALSPTKDADIVRHLEALDLVDRALRMTLEVGVERVDRIAIQLDPRLTSRQGVGAIEKTRITFTMSGKPGPMVAFLSRTQEARVVDDGSLAAGPLVIEKVDMETARAKPDEVGLEVVFVVARLAPETPVQE